AISQGVNWSMKSWGSGMVCVTVYICRSVAKCGYVSRLAGSDEKYTDATTDLISISMPALAAACLTMAWVFWREGLIEVWYTNFSFLPSLPRMPSEPFFHPAASRIWLALSTLYSNFVLLDTKRE